MVLTEELRVFDGDTLKENFLKPLSEEITAINKYTVLPVYVLSFLIDRVSFIPTLVLSAYDDKFLMTETASVDPKLEQKVLDDTPTVVYPTVIIFPSSLKSSDVLFSRSEMFIYSTSFVLSGKDVKAVIDKEDIFKRIAIKCNPSRTVFSVSIEGRANSNLYIQPISDSAEVVRLPFSNYAKKHNSYTGIISEISANKGVQVIDTPDNKDAISKLFDTVKQEQWCTIPGTDIKLFKDFMKQKPTNLVVYSCEDVVTPIAKTNNASKLVIKNVCLKMDYKSSKLTHVLFYRYMSGVVSDIKGTYMEGDEIDGNTVS